MLPNKEVQPQPQQEKPHAIDLTIEQAQDPTMQPKGAHVRDHVELDIPDDQIPPVPDLTLKNG